MSLLKVILAEDDPDDRFLIEEALFALKSVVTSTTFFTNGKDFWSFLQQIDTADLLPDLVVLDLNLPFMDGLSILKNIRNSSHLKDLPVFILTTSNKSRPAVRVILWNPTAWGSCRRSFPEYYLPYVWINLSALGNDGKKSF
jgi:CheY-like chemotaxis protein